MKKGKLVQHSKIEVGRGCKILVCVFHTKSVQDNTNTDWQVVEVAIDYVSDYKDL